MRKKDNRGGPKVEFDFERGPNFGYDRRDEILAGLRFPTYGHYLRSATWQWVRTKVFREKGSHCTICGNRATELHHNQYSRDVLLGKDIEPIYPICRDCHKRIEFDGGSKVDLDGARKKFFSSRLVAAGQPGPPKPPKKKFDPRTFVPKKPKGPGGPFWNGQPVQSIRNAELKAALDCRLVLDRDVADQIEKELKDREVGKQRTAEMKRRKDAKKAWAAEIRNRRINARTAPLPPSILVALEWGRLIPIGRATREELHRLASARIADPATAILAAEELSRRDGRPTPAARRKKDRDAGKLEASRQAGARRAKARRHEQSTNEPVKCGKPPQAPEQPRERHLRDSARDGAAGPGLAARARGIREAMRDNSSRAV